MLKSELARELEITATLLYKWCKESEEFGEASFSGNLKLTPDQERIKEFEKQLTTSRLEHEILKKVIGVFSKTGK